MVLPWMGYSLLECNFKILLGNVTNVILKKIYIKYFFSNKFSN
jgi:hypothetical protein